MSNEQYTRVALDERDADIAPNCDSRPERKHSLKNTLGISALALCIFAVGFVAGGAWAGVPKTRLHIKTSSNGLLDPQRFIPDSAFNHRWVEYWENEAHAF